MPLSKFSKISVEIHSFKPTPAEKNGRASDLQKELKPIRKPKPEYEQRAHVDFSELPARTIKAADRVALRDREAES